MKKSISEVIEMQELIQKLVDNGYGKLVDAFLYNETCCFTKKSRLNKSGCCRVLNCKPKQLEDALAECRKIIGIDLWK